MSWIFSFARMVALAIGLSAVLTWLKQDTVGLAVTLPWMLYPISGGMVVARATMDWEETRKDAQIVTGALRIAAFFAIVAIAHWGFPGSLTAVTLAFLATLALGCYRKE